MYVLYSGKDKKGELSDDAFDCKRRRYMAQMFVYGQIYVFLERLCEGLDSNSIEYACAHRELKRYKNAYCNHSEWLASLSEWEHVSDDSKKED